MKQARNNFTKLVREMDLYRNNELRKVIQDLLISYDIMSKKIDKQIGEMEQLKDNNELLKAKLESESILPQEKLIKIVAYEFGQTKSSIRGSSKKGELVFCRQLISVIIRCEELMTLGEITLFLNRKAHASIINNIRSFKSFYNFEKNFKNKVERFVLKYYDNNLLEKINEYTKHDRC